jgi:phytoene dehydrogenase-like protein
MYDAAIIGAGVGGLVCGCYLAKAGMKVLIAEQHDRPGGYCASFKRKGFIFDAAAHSFGGYREGGITKRVFHDLEIHNHVSIKRYNPSDIILTSDHKVSFFSDLKETIETFQRAFPDESANIARFFHFLTNPDPTSSARMRNWTLRILLDTFFTNQTLKAILAFPLFGNGGLPPSLMSAFTGAQIFTEFLIDGGYYPEGGMQTLPDALAKRFIDLGGTILLSSAVTKINLKDNKVLGVTIDKGNSVQSKYVISNCDARQTFLNLVGKKLLPREFLNRIDSMVPSISMFVAYLGISGAVHALPPPGCTLWFLPHHRIEDMYVSAMRRNERNLTEFLLHVSPVGRSIIAMATASFRNKRYWDNHKHRMLEALIKNIERSAIPGLSMHIRYQDAATPCTLLRYTLNNKGAAYGWASTPSQFADPDFRRPSFIEGLYLTGHWTTLGFGIPGVSYIGRDTANMILKRRKR